MKKKGLMVSVYRTDYDCTINKFYGKKNLVLVDDKINMPVFYPTEEMPEIKLVWRQLQNGEYIHAEPAEVGFYAFGGTFIYCSESRFGELSKYPIPLHDRQMNLEK